MLELKSQWIQEEHKKRGEAEGEEEWEIDVEDLHKVQIKMLGDVVEALFGAVLIDSLSVEKCQEVFYMVLKRHLHQYGERARNHPKGRLQEMRNEHFFLKEHTVSHRSFDRNGNKLFKGTVSGRVILRREFV